VFPATASGDTGGFLRIVALQFVTALAFADDQVGDAAASFANCLVVVNGGREQQLVAGSGIGLTKAYSRARVNGDSFDALDVREFCAASPQSLRVLRKTPDPRLYLERRAGR